MALWLVGAMGGRSPSLAVASSLEPTVPASNDLAAEARPPETQPLAPLRAGGPDGFGYVFTDSRESGAGAPTYGWYDARDNGTDTGIDEGHKSVHAELPFGFKFYGNTYNSLNIDLNGYLTFGPDPQQGDNVRLSDSQAVTNVVAVFWDSLTSSSCVQGCVYTDVLGTAPNRVFFVEWYDLVPRGDSYSSGVTFEVALYENSNKIVMQYADTTFGNSLYDNGASATVGLANKNAQIWSEYCYGTNPACNLTAGLAIAFHHPDSIGARPDLLVTKVGTREVQPGGTVTYTIHYSNTGSRLASNVRITDTLQGGLQYGSADPAPDSVNGNVLVWSVGDLPVLGSGASSDPGSGTITVYATAPTTATAGLSFLNHVEIGSANQDQAPENNSDTESTVVIPGPPASVNIARDPLSLPANNFSMAHITLTVKDIAGNNVKDGTDVILKTDVGHFYSNGKGAITLSTSSGVASTLFQAGTVVGTAHITATALGGSNPVADTTITLTTAAPAAITLRADPESIFANGFSKSGITAVVSDSLGGYASDGSAVSFATNLGTLDGGGVTANRVLAGGMATVSLQSSIAGTATITGTVGSASGTVTVTVMSQEVVTIPLDAGWNLISFGITPTPSDTASVLAPLGSNLIVAQGFDGGGLSYYPGSSQNTLTHIDALHGYWIKVQTDDTLRVIGDPVYSTTVIPLNAGWNLISYLPDTPLPLESALSSLGDIYDAVLGFDQGVTSYYRSLPEKMNSLSVLEPRRGYWLYLRGRDWLCYAGPENCR
jgi:uncharacterized repeat protein (TIGR01451 family)